MNNENYKKIYNIVEKYDVMGIACCSSDEYEPEAKDIANLDHSQSEEELAKQIRLVFERWFMPMLLPKENQVFLNMAKEIKQIINKNTLTNALIKGI